MLIKINKNLSLWRSDKIRWGLILANEDNRIWIISFER